jgi:hypothetical protein
MEKCCLLKLFLEWEWGNEGEWWKGEFKYKCISVNSKWIKDLIIRPETLKLVQERAGNTLEAIGTGKDFLNRT